MKGNLIPAKYFKINQSFKSDLIELDFLIWTMGTEEWSYSCICKPETEGKAFCILWLPTAKLYNILHFTKIFWKTKQIELKLLMNIMQVCGFSGLLFSVHLLMCFFIELHIQAYNSGDTQAAFSLHQHIHWKRLLREEVHYFTVKNINLPLDT